jgi:hypothetical protein
VAVDNYFAVHDPFSVRRHHPVSFFSAKNCLIKLERRESVGNTEVWNELIFSMHGLLLLH